MLKDFDRRLFKLHGIVPSFLVTLGGKTVTLEEEVVNTPIEYNLLLGHSWIHAMEDVPSLFFRCIKLFHEGRVVTIDQLLFCNMPNEPRTIVPFVDNSTPACENIGVGLYPSSMGSFNFASPVLSTKSFPIYAITQIAGDQEVNEVSFKTNYLSDPCTLPKSDMQVEEKRFMGMVSPLSAVEVAYQAIQEKTTEASSPHSFDEKEDQYPMSVLSMDSSIDSKPLDIVLLSNEPIMEVMCPLGKPWLISHHRSSFIPMENRLKNIESKFTMNKEVDWFKCPYPTQSVFVEGNL